MFWMLRLPWTALDSKRLQDLRDICPEGPGLADGHAVGSARDAFEPPSTAIRQNGVKPEFSDESLYLWVLP